MAIIPHTPASGRFPKERSSNRVQRLLRRSLWAIVTLTVVIVLALWLFLSNLDRNALRDQLTELASSGSGYQVAVKGPFEIRFFPTPRLRAEQVSLTSPQTPNEPFAEVQEVTLSIDLLSSLFEQDLILGTATLSGTEITLVERTDGTGNWLPTPTSPPSPSVKKEASRSVTASGPPLMPKALVVTNLEGFHASRGAFLCGGVQGHPVEHALHSRARPTG